MENFNYICHIINLNNKDKKKFIDEFQSDFNIIDLDKINNIVISDDRLDKLYLKYEKLKNSKNDKFKEIDKQITQFWETQFIENIISASSKSKKNILIGLNYHYKNISKKINLNTSNNFIINVNLIEDVKLTIENNLNLNKQNIINGLYPLEYINFENIKKKKENIINSYIKINYISKSFDEIVNILKTSSNIKNNNGLWICLRDPYNVDSKIYPQDAPIIAYSEKEFALIDSFDLKENEVEKIISTENDTPTISLKEIKENSLNKLKKKRFLYYVDKDNFLPYENNINKYFTNTPVKVKHAEKITNVYDYLAI
jgi:hypothetical protein